AREEIDAIRTLGLDPVELLVLPRTLALLIALPLLTFVSMLAGIVGGAVVCLATLKMSPSMFLTMFQDDMSISQFLVGMAKAPVFAFMIATIGCMEGFKTAPIAASEAVIEVRGLVNRFGTQTVHEDLDLDVRRGEIIGIVGGSGTGKSVLLRTIVGLVRPVAGEVRVFGENLLALDEDRRSLVERRFGVLFQSGALFSSLTVAENVALPLVEHAKLPRPDAQRLAGVKLALSGLPVDAGRKYPSQLSGGMIKRAALARALALDPEILFLDEPTAGLDPISAAAFDSLIVTLRDALGLTVFLVTHDLDTLYSTCDRVAVLSQRRVLAVGPIDEVARTDDAWARIDPMETRAHHILIGLFTVIVVIAALLFGVWLAKAHSDQEWNYYDVVFNEAVTGLSRGGAVQYNGIRLGDVMQLKLDP
ncbi:hypothetical protein KCV01_g23255, partial [Aureobasidium melanogenum]